ncbi:MAG: PAS domain S-box protein [Thermodesulfobacteria bacterium]|nr:PAS domain S-box protein [Thermodesulfobacteriota bacterium]
MIPRENTNKEEFLAHALEESEIKFRTLTESAAVGIFLYRERFLYVNPAFERITGYSRKELEKLYLWDIVHPDFKDLVRERVLARLRGESPPPHYEVKIITKEGQEKWLEVTAATFQKEGQIVGIGTAIDITKQKKFAQKLEETLAQYQAILNAFEGLIYAVSEDFKIHFANHKCQARTSRELKGETCYKSLYGLGSPCPWCCLQEVLSGRSVQKEVYIPSEGRWYHMVGTPLRYPSGGNYALYLLMDITEQKKAQEELVRATKLESLALLAGGIAHDFNNFLMAILGNLSLLRFKARLSPKEEKLLRQTEKACLKAQGLTKQLLTFAKGGAPIKKAAPLEELLRETISFCLRGSHVDWELRMDEDLFLVEIDTTQFGQVISNLVINAKQAMPEGGRLWVQAKNLVLEEQRGPLAPGKYVELSFRDEGCGIPKKYLSKIFDPYFTTKEEGSGLGLAICYSIIKRHGGHIEVESEEDKGTTFRIYLPASEKELPEAPQLIQREIFKAKAVSWSLTTKRSCERP